MVSIRGERVTYVQPALELAIASQLDADYLVKQKADEVHGLGNGAGVFYCVGHFVMCN